MLEPNYNTKDNLILMSFVPSLIHCMPRDQGYWHERGAFCCSGGRLATMLVATINTIIPPPNFFHFFSIRPFHIEGVLGSKNLFGVS